ncbi:MAG: hypothetical protein AUF79_19040 [Crenarchaeota archaeon 13_1_20CM_2_51_8]|nr:MAG: hypothetical protein AUF79_19040 [Crenarchaeota archaeon 13_1_20CM_2_51_8]
MARITTDPEEKLRLRSTMSCVYCSVEALKPSASIGWIDRRGGGVEDLVVHVETPVDLSRM